MTDISVELPDGSIRKLPEGSNAMDLAMDIAEGLARQVVVSKVNGVVQDVRIPLIEGDKVELLKVDSPEGLDTLRHSAEHVLATAVTELFEGAQVTMGPKSHAGDFHYDFDIGRPFMPEDVAAIEKRMKEIIKKKTPFTREVMTKEDAGKLFADLNQRFKPEILSWIPDDTVSIYKTSDFVDLCRGPHLPHAGFIKAFTLFGSSGAYWRADANRDPLQRISGIAFPKKAALEEHLQLIEEHKKRDHRKLGKALELFVVSEKYDNHDYDTESDVEMLVTGSVSENALRSGKLRADSVLDDDLLDGLREVFAPRSVKMNGYNVTAHESEARPMIDVMIRLSAGRLTKEQRAQLATLEKATNQKFGSPEEGGVRIIVDPHYSEEVGPGLVLWLPKGGRVRTVVENQWRKMHQEAGYEIVYSPHLAKSDLWKVSGHWNFYRESMFSPMAVDGQEYVAKPMNCPFHIMMFKSRSRSYRDLPFRWAELGTVYRNEMAGALHGLMRVRGFTQDDAHIFCRWDQLGEELDRVIGFVLRVLRTFGFDEFEVNLSTRPEKYVGELEEWAKSEDALENAVKRHDLPFVVDEGGGAFYGPKIDIKLKDCLGRMWQCSTIQLDFNNPERFSLSFINSEGKPEQPLMIHRALLGSIERFIGILIEQYAGAFPMWLAPEQIRVLTIADRFFDHAKKVGDALTAAGLRVEVPTSSDKLGAKIRNAQIDKVPVMLIIGEQEVEKGGGAIRLRDGTDLGFMTTEELVAHCKEMAIIPEA